MNRHAAGERAVRARIQGRALLRLRGRHIAARAGVALAALAAPTFGATLQLSAQTSVTIYNDGRVLERRVFPIPVPAGVSTHRLPVGQVDPASLFALDSGVVLTGATYDAAQDEANTLRRALGRRITFLTGGRTNGVPDTVVAEVVGADPLRLRMTDGRIVFRSPGTPVFPADLVLSDPAALVTVRSDRARPVLALGYFASGANWQAAYAITLGRGMAQVAGHAAIQAGPLRLDSAEVQLLAGSVGRADRMPAPPVALRAMAAEAAADQQAVGEAHLYTLPGRLSLTPGLARTALLFEPAAVPVERAYVVRGQVPFYGPLPQYGDEATEPVAVTYTLQRRARTAFGDAPLPAGVARLYERDAGGRPQLIGEAAVSHTAAGQNVTLEAGVAFDLTARRIQTSYATRRDSLRTQATVGYTVTLANAKDSAVTIDVLERRSGEWAVLASSVPAERLSSTVTRFRVRVPANGEATLTYRLRIVW